MLGQDGASTATSVPESPLPPWPKVTGWGRRHKISAGRWQRGTDPLVGPSPGLPRCLPAAHKGTGAGPHPDSLRGGAAQGDHPARGEEKKLYKKKKTNQKNSTHGLRQLRKAATRPGPVMLRGAAATPPNSQHPKILQALPWGRIGGNLARQPPPAPAPSRAASTSPSFPCWGGLFSAVY